MPPAAINASTNQWKGGTVLPSSVLHKLANWLNKIIYKLFAAAVFVSMLKK